jgi:hypothetical protein
VDVGGEGEDGVGTTWIWMRVRRMDRVVGFFWSMISRFDVFGF